MARKTFQFRLAALVWLVVGSALLFGMIRLATSGAPGRINPQYDNHISQFLKSAGVSGRRADELSLVLLIAPFVLGPIVMLYLLRPRSDCRRRQTIVCTRERAVPIEQRLQRFMSNVTPIEIPTGPAEHNSVLPDSLDGKAARTQRELSEALGRIHEAAAARPRQSPD